MMRRTQVFFGIAMLAILVMSTAVLTSSTAADYSKVGVKKGVTATYSYALIGSKVNKATFRFVNVTGTLVQVIDTFYNPDGSVNGTEFSLVSNVSTGQYGIYEFLICANLAANDPIYIGAPFAINETISMNAGGATRTVNHINATFYGSRVNEWWDKQTGIMVKLVAGAQNFTLTSTSLWSPDITLLIISGVVVAVAVIAAVALLVRRHRRFK